VSKLKIVKYNEWTKNRKMKFFSVFLLIFTMITISGIIPGRAQDDPTGTLKTGTVGWWPGDGHALDISNGSHGTLMNGASFAPGLVGQAFEFHGGDDYVWAYGQSTVNLEVLTIETWVLIDNIVTNQQRFVTNYSKINGTMLQELMMVI
jgi:hypothetical protein